MRRHAGDESQGRAGHFPMRRTASDRCVVQQRLRGHAPPRRRGAIGRGAGSHDKGVCVISSVKEPTFTIAEMINNDLQHNTGPVKPHRRSGGHAKANKSISNAGIVFQHCLRYTTHPIPRGAHQSIGPAIRAQMSGDKQVTGHFSGSNPFGAIERRTCLGQGGDHHPVPRRHNFIVACRSLSVVPSRHQLSAAAQPAVLIVRVSSQLHRGRAIFECSGSGYFTQALNPVGIILRQHLTQQSWAPDIEGALMALTIGIQSSSKTTLGGLHFTEQKLHGVSHDALRQRCPTYSPPTRIGAQQERIVVEHFLKVGHHPGIVNGVASKPTPELVVHATARHCRAREFNQSQRLWIPGAGMVAE